MKKLYIGAVPTGTCLFTTLVAVFVISCVNSQTLRRTVASSGNETVLLGNLNATGEILKRVGEFSSRVLWVRKGKFILPAGTILTLAPKITVPAFRQKAYKGGLNSDIQASIYLYVNCDKLGFTHDMHPWPFDRPPFYPFGSLMRPIDSKDYPKKEPPKEQNPMKKGEGHHNHMKPSKIPEHGSVDYDDIITYKSNKGSVATFFPVAPLFKRSGSEQQQQKVSGGHRRPRRAVMSLPPPDELPGGERAVLLPGVESMLANFGFQGRGCMLRAICEIHEFPIQEGYGLLGEMITLFFSISQSPYAESHMPEYLKAEEAGRNGNCAAYRSQCAKSIFKWEVGKKPTEEETNEVPVSLLRSKYDDDEL